MNSTSSSYPHPPAGSLLPSICFLISLSLSWSVCQQKYPIGQHLLLVPYEDLDVVELPQQLFALLLYVGVEALTQLSLLVLQLFIVLFEFLDPALQYIFRKSVHHVVFLQALSMGLPRVVQFVSE